MPIFTIQQRLRELGRIRIGDTEPFMKNGEEKRRPVKLEHFRLTSPSKPLIEAAAGMYGGTVEPWDEQWEVVTERSELPVALAPMEVMDQWMELWSGGGCQRRCDGQTEVLSMKPCLCNPDDRECKPTTRLRVILHELPGVGVWRLETHGYYAASELSGVAQILAVATQQSQALPASLRIEKREIKRPGEQTKKFIVPVIDVDAPLGQVLESIGAVSMPGENVAASQPGRRATQRLPLGESPGLPSQPAGRVGSHAPPLGPAPGLPSEPSAQDEHARLLRQVEALLAKASAAGVDVDPYGVRDYAGKKAENAAAAVERLESLIPEDAA